MTEADEKATHDWPKVSPARMLLEAASTGRRAQVPAAPAGHGRPVLLVAGFGAPNKSLDRLSTWLRASDWRTYRAPIGINVNCSQRTIDILISRAEAVHEATGQRLLVIGQSTALSAPPPEGVRAFAVYSPIDEIVSPAACADPHADCRSVDSTHQMMGMNVAVWGEIIKILGDLEGARLRLDLLIPAG